MATSGGDLYTDGGVLLLILFWIVLWSIANPLVGSLHAGFRAKAVLFYPTRLDLYRRRLCRSQVYCFVAVIGGVRLLSTCKKLPYDLLYAFSEEHQVLFSMAVGHWLVSIYEDINSNELLKSGLRKTDVSGLGMDAGWYLELAYLLHHLIAALGYFVILQLQACTAVGAFGLLFELPVLLLNHREFMVFAEDPPRWFCNAANVQCYWTVTHFVFALARGGPTLVYVYSLCSWQADLSKLSIMESFVYHSMAIFFAALNIRYQTEFLTAWAKRDRDVAMKGKNGSLAAAFKVEKKEPPRPINEDVPPLVQVPLELLSQKNGTPGLDQKPEYWIVIDSLVYDVTSFMQEHPGGESVLRKYAGHDASEAFKRVGHSVAAKVRMAQLAVGELLRPLKEYRIFEHGVLELNTISEMIFVAFFYGGSSALLGNSLYLRAEADLSIAAIMSPIFLLSMVSAGCVSLGVLFQDPADCLMFPGMKSHVMAWQIILHNAGLLLVRRPLPSSLPEACPTGLELAAASLFFAEDVFQICSGTFNFSPAVLLAYGGVLTSWSLRGIDALPAGTSAVGLSHLVGALLLAYSLSRLTRKIHLDGDKKEISVEILWAFLLSGAYSFPALYVSILLDPAAWEVFASYWSVSFWNMIGVVLAAGAVALGLIMLLNSAYVCSPSWAAREGAGILAVGVWYAGGLSNFRWIGVAAFISHLGALSARNRSYMEQAKSEGKLDKVAAYMLGTQAAWDRIRSALITVIWQISICTAKAVVNRLLPEELCVYACEIPIFDLGNGVDLGMAAFFSPDHDEAESDNNYGLEAGCQNDLPESAKQGKPDFFVCNVGHIDNTHVAGLSDIQHTMNALRDIWVEFQRPDVKGIVSNIVCVFPHVEGTSLMKEINLSAWTSAQEAHDWYVRSPGHRRTMVEHSGGRLRTFGNLLASLRPVGKARHQDRCQRCARLVESPTLGERAPEWCGACGAATFGYPYF